MPETEIKNRISQQLSETGIDTKQLESLAGSLVWRIGRLTDDAPLTVRVGLASSVPLFNELPKLRNASEAEIEAAFKEDAIRLEWVGRIPQ